MQMFIKILFYATLLLVGIVFLSAMGFRFDLLGLGLAFQAMFISFGVTALIALVTISVLFIQIIRRKTDTLALPFITIVIGVFFAGYGLVQYNKTQTVPPIHNLSTDLDNPPAFSVGMIDLRGENSNPLEIPDQVKDMQRSAYADLKPLVLSGSLTQNYPHALDVVKDMGWEIHLEDDVAGTIEATDTTFWLGFKDDVLVQLSDDMEAGTTTVNVRSVSRMGATDLGVNNDRIQAYLRDLSEVAQIASPE